MSDKFRLIVSSLSAKERATFALGAFVFLTSVALLGFKGFIAATEATPGSGGVWREGIVGQPIFVNPVIGTNDADRDLSALLFAPLRELAESIKESKGGRVWSVRLKEKIFWNDGTPITSDDLIFTVETIANPDARSPLFQTFDGASVRRVSSIETEFTLPSPYVFFGDSLRALRPIPKHALGNIPAANFRLSSYVLEPIGSGAFEFESLAKERDGFVREYRLKRTRGARGGDALLAGVVFSFFADEESLIESFNRGEVDGFVLGNPKNLGSVTLRREARGIPSLRAYAVFINQDLAPKLRDIGVRATLSAAIPREEIVRDVLAGYGTPLESILPGRKSEAKQKPIPDELALDILTPSTPVLVEAAARIKAAWEALGVRTEILAVRPEEVHQAIKERGYELVLFGNARSNPEDFFSFWHSSKRLYPGQNLSLYENRNVDALLEATRSDPDATRRSRSIDVINETIADELPAFFLYSPDYLYVTATRLKGFAAKVPAASASDRFANVTEWHVKTVRRFR